MEKKRLIPIILGSVGGAALVAGISLIAVGATRKPTYEKDTRPVITFNVGDAIIVNGDTSMRVEANTEFGSINKPVLEKDGKIFAGWYKDEACSEGQEILDTDKITTNTNVFVKWADDTNVYIDFTAGDSGATLTGITKVAITQGAKFKTINKPIATWSDTTKTFRAWQRGEYDILEDDAITTNTRLTPGYNQSTTQTTHVIYAIKPEEVGKGPTLKGLCEYDVAAETIFQTTTKPTPIWNGHTFNKWVRSDGKGGYEDVPTSYPLPAGATSTFYADFSEADTDEKISCKIDGKDAWLTNETDTSGDLVFINSEGNEVKVARETFDAELNIGSKRKSLDINFLFNCQKFNNGGKPLVMPASLEIINASFLHNCKEFNQKIDFSACTNLTEIGNSFLHKCEDFNSEIIFPATVNENFYIGNYFLFECTAFNQKITLPKTMTVISGSFLEGCIAYNNGDPVGTSNTPFEFPTSLTNINPYFLARCNSFNQKVNVPNTVTTIAEDFLYDCTSFNQEVTLPENTEFTKIYDAFMTGCTSFNQQITIPNTVVNIADYFMYTCTSFAQTMKLPDTLGTIGMYFMSRCTSYNSNLTIPASITSVGVGFMYYCNSYISTITIQCSHQRFEQSEYTLATGSPHAACYTGGITITGTYSSNFKSRFKDSSSIPYRNLN